MQTRRLLLAALTLGCAFPAHALELPETRIAYEIEVTLDSTTRGLEGRETIRWTNPSAGAVERIPLHLYLNGFSHEDTTWGRSSPACRTLWATTRVDDLRARPDEPWRVFHRMGLGRSRS